MANYDGRIVLRTDVDVSGVKKGTDNIKNAVEKTGQGFKNIGSTLSKALQEGDAKTAQLANNFQKATAEAEKQAAKVDELRAHLAQLESGTVTVKDSAAAKIQRDFEKAGASIEKTKAEIEEVYAQLDQLQSNAFVAPNGEVVLSGAEQAEFDKMNAKLDELEPKLEADKQKAAELGEALKNAVGTATQAEIDKTKTKLTEAESKLSDLSVKAEIAGQKLKMEGTEPKISAVSAGFEKLGNRITGLVKRVFVFTLITKALRALRSTVGSILMSDESFRQSLYALQAALWVAFAPILNYVVPALKTLINWITAAIVSITRFIALLTGKSYSSMVDNGKKLQEQAAAYEAVGSGGASAAKGMKKATDEAKKQLAAFDDLNILSEDKASADSSDTGSGAGAGTSGISGADFENIKEMGTEPISTTMATIMGIIGGALAAVGLVLIMNGHIGWGIGFIIAGAAVFGVGIATLSNYSPSGIETVLYYLLGIAGAVLAAIGLILLFNGQIGWGIGFIIQGAAMFGVSYAALSGEDVTQNATNALLTLLGIVGGALVAIGIMLIFLGSVAWGIGFIIAGAAVFGVGIATIAKFSTNKIESVIMMIEGIAAGALLALGIMLLIFGGANPLSIGLIAAGAALLAVTAAQIVAGQVENDVAQTIHIITSIASAALLALGIILVCTGVSLPLGIGLIAAGAAGLAAEAALNWAFIKEKTGQFLEDNKGLIVGVSLALLVLGIILVLAGVSLPLGIGLIAAGAVGLAAEAALNWDSIKTTIEDTVNNIGNWCKTWGLLVLGIILAFSGVGLPLGIALMKKGAANLTEAQDPMWDTITNKVKEVWEGVQQYWDQHIAKYFTAEWWGNLAKDAINGFIKWFINGLNKLIDKINSFGFELPEVLGGGRIGFNIPTLSVPQLAKGGIVPYATLAEIGERGKEAVLPLESNTEWMDMLADRIAARNGGSGSTTVVLEIDGREFGRAVVEQGSKESRRIGTRLVIA